MVQMNLFVRQKWRHRRREWTGGHRGRRWGWDEFGKEHWHKYNAMCRLDRWREAAVQHRATSSVLCIDREVGWEVRREGGDICICGCCSVALSCLTLCNPMDCITSGFPVLQSPGVCSNSCPFNRWCQPTILSSVIPFFSCPLFFQARGLFQWISSLH